MKMAPEPTWISELDATSLVIDEAVATVTLRRPDAANARNQAMRVELGRIWDHVGNRTDVSVVILTGSGERFFCAGMDLKEAGELEPRHRATSCDPATDHCRNQWLRVRWRIRDGAGV
jgi:enoyl-CoA hydratase/carnithine racemase